MLYGRFATIAGAFGTELLARIDAQRIACHDIEPAGIAGGDLFKRGDCALIAFDGNDAAGPECQQGAREPARARVRFRRR